MDIKDILRDRRQELGLTMKEVADKVGVSEGTISRWESGEIANMRRDKIISLASALQLTPGIIMGWEDKPVTIPSFPNVHPIAKKSFPLFDGIACGEPRLMPDGIELYVDAAADIKADYVLIAHGDSMIGARIHDKDYVFIRQQSDVENGEIAAVAIGDEATLKRVYWYASRQLLVLRAENPDYADIEISGPDLENVRILGKAVAFQSDLK